MSTPTTQEKQRAALEEITRAMNLLLNEIVGTTDGGVKPETFDRAKRAYDQATRALYDDMRHFRELLEKRNPNAPPMNGADNASPRSDRPDLAAPAVLPLLPEDQEAMQEALAALEGVIAWDKQRQYIVPYKVRDPVYEAILSLGHALAARLSNQPPKD